MILELHVTAKNLDSPVFRTIQVPQTISFSQLDEMISIAFHHMHTDSFVFELEKSNGHPLLDTYIGVDFNEDFAIDESLILDDEEETLDDWFQAIGDCATYLISEGKYAFSIEITNIIPPTPALHYPICLAAEGHLRTGPATVINLTDLSLAMQMMGTLDDTDLFEEQEPEWTDILDIAHTFNQLKPWDYFYDNEIIVIEDPLSQDLLFASVLGAAGEEFGLVIYINHEGHELLNKIFLNQLTEDYFFEVESLNVSFVNRDELEPFDYQLIKDAGLSFRGKKKWIQFRSYSPGQFPWLPDADDVDTLALVINQMIQMVEARKKGWTYPPLPANCYVYRFLDPATHTWQQNLIEIAPLNDDDEELYIELSPFEIKKLQKKKKSGVHLEFDLFYLPHAVQEHINDRPFYPLMAVAIDKKTGMVIFQDILPIQKDVIISQTVFSTLLQSLDYQPHTISVTPEMAKSLTIVADITKNKLKITTDFEQLEQFKQYVRNTPFD